MLKKLILENWKSFRYAELPIDPLTILIGTNASGKSNLIEALSFLKTLTRGVKIQAIFSSSNFGNSWIRGGVDWITFQHEEEFSIKTVIQGIEAETEYVYTIRVRIKPIIKLIFEQLELLEFKGSDCRIVSLFKVITNFPENEPPILSLFGKEAFPFKVMDNSCALSYLSVPSFSFPTLLDSLQQEQLSTVLDRVMLTLSGTLIFDPIPSTMRSYSSLSYELSNDGSNIAGVLAGLSEEKKAEIEAILSSYVAHLPEKDIQRVWAEPVGRLSSDAMLYCEESWVPGEPPMIVDARGMSDGTLRFLAILTALLTRPEGSQLAIEDVDNGLHPSRVGLLLKMLREVGSKRNIDILVTTHNPALLNVLPPEMTPFVVVAHRDPETGESKLTPLDQLENLPKLLASGLIGDLASRGAIEQSLANQSSPHQ